MALMRALSTATCAVVLLGCPSAEPEPEAERGVAVRDSAGVTIAETPGQIWSDAPRWTTSPEPVVEIGAVEGSPEYLLSRVGGVATLTDGRVVVSDGGSNSIRWYDPSGRYLFERGGAGEGPGEFRWNGPILRIPGDTLSVTDLRLRRITEFGPAGDLIRTIPIEGVTVPGVAHRLPDGTYIVGSGGFSSTQFTGEEEGLARRSEPLLRFGPGLDAADTVGMFPGPEMYFTERSFGFHPFSRGFHYAVAGGLLWVAAAEGFVVDAYSPDGRLVRSIRAPDVDLRLTPEAIERYEEGVRDAAAEQGDARADAAIERLEEMYYPEQRPAYGGLVAGDESIWLAEHRAGRAEGRTRWAVFGHDGDHHGTALLPAGFRLLDVRGDRVLGTWTDELGVEYVRIHRLVAAEGTGS